MLKHSKQNTTIITIIMSDQVLSLKWNNHQMSFTNRVAFIYNKEKYADVTIACDENFYPAHKIVLSTCSEYFDTMFSFVEGKHPIVVLKDISRNIIELLLSYMYLGEVNVDQADLPSLMKAAECLRIKGLAVTDTDEKQLKRKIPTEDTPRKRRNIESDPLNDETEQNIDESDKPVVHSVDESGTSKDIKQGDTADSVIESEDFQDIICEPIIKAEKVEADTQDHSTKDDNYCKDLPTQNFSTSNAGNYMDESGVSGEQQMEEFRDFPMDSFDSLPLDDTERDFNLDLPGFPGNIISKRVLLIQELAEKMRLEYMKTLATARGSEACTSVAGVNEHKRRQCQIRKHCVQNKTKLYCAECKKAVCGKCTGNVKYLCVNCQTEVL